MRTTTTDTPPRRPGPKLPDLALTDDERATLERWARRRNSSQALALRCRIVLACAEGHSNQAVAARLGISKPTVTKWRSRFVARRLEGLGDHRRAGRAGAGDDPGGHAGRRHPLVDPQPGPPAGHVAVGDQPDLAGVRAQAAPGRHLQAVHRPAVHRQGPRCRWAVPRPTPGGDG